MIDENGHPLQIDAVTLTIALYGPFAETSVEVAFTNPSNLSDEAHFELPIPSDGARDGLRTGREWRDDTGCRSTQRRRTGDFSKPVNIRFLQITMAVNR